MARIVCQVLHRSDRITFLWSEGDAFFEPYHLDGADRANLLHLAREIHVLLAAPGQNPGAELAQRGHALHRLIFRFDAAHPGSAPAVHEWFAQLARADRIERLEILSDSPGLIPWNALVDEPGEGWQRFWGVRFNLGVGRRVNALRANPVQMNPTQLFAADLTLVEQLAAEQKQRLNPLRDAGQLHHGTAALADDLNQHVPDLLSLLVRFEQGQLWLGADAFSIADLQAWIDATKDGNPDPLVIVMASGSAADQAAWEEFLAAATAAFSGLVANETLLGAAQAFAVGQALGQRFMQAERSLGEILCQLRRENGCAGLAFSAFAPPQLRVIQEAAPMEPDTDIDIETTPLPSLPYHPFAAYEASERALFFGREEDTLRGAAVVDQAAAHGVFLHGAPGAGKTSYLQAGLLPYLEQECLGFRILRDRSPLDSPVAERDYPILILRCTSDLAGQFADALSVFCAQPLTYTTPTGAPITVDLPGLLQKALTGAAKTSTAIQAAAATAITASAGEAEGASAETEGATARELWIALRDNKEMLGALLDTITRSLPFELVIVVDQGEELVSLVQTAQQKVRRQKALDMLMHLSYSADRCKILFTLRSQALGQLISLLPGGQAPAAWRTFYLRPLTEPEMVDALLWPTNRENIPYTEDIPYTKYHFAYEEGLAQHIVAEAIETAAAEQQSPLPLLHAVGALLYEKQVLLKQQDVLRAVQLKEIGGVKEAMGKYLEQSLQKLTISSAARKALRELIGKLYTGHADGALSRDLVAASELKAHWHGCNDPVEPIVNKAAEEQGLFDIQQLLIGGQPDVYVSLPQDSLAHLGKKMAGDRAMQAHARTKVIDVLWVMIPLMFLAAAVTFWATRNFWGGALTQELLQKVVAESEKESKEKADIRMRQLHNELRRPLYYGLLARADQALHADNALHARQILLSQPAMRSYVEDAKNSRLPDLRGFEWKYLWKHLNSERFAFLGHRGIINGVAIAPDGLRAASVSAASDGVKDGTIRIWNLANGEILALVPGKRTPVFAVAFAPDGKTLATAGADKIIRLWDLSKLKTDYVEITQEKKSLTGHSDAVHALAFGKDGLTLASSGADKSVLIWDLATDKVKHKLTEHAAAVAALAYTADGATLVSAGAEAQVFVWDADTGKKRQTIKTAYQAIAATGVSSDGKTLCTGGVETRLDSELGMLRFWNLDNAKETHHAIHHSAGILSLAFGPDGKTVASGGRDHVIRLWDAATGKERQRWIGHLSSIRSLAFAKDGSAIVSGDFEGVVKAWNPEQSSGPDVLQAHADWVQCLALNPKNTLLASGARDGSVKLWNPQSGKMLLPLPPHAGAVTSLAFSSHKDKAYLAVGTRDDKNEGEIKIWQIEIDAKDGPKVKERYTLKEHKKGVTCLAFHPSPDRANVLISGSADHTVKVWDLETGTEKMTYRGHKDEVRCLTFSYDQRSFASGGKDALVCLYELNSKDIGILPDLHLASIESIAIVPLLVMGGDVRGTVPGMLTGSADQSMRLWRYERIERGPVDKKEMRAFRTHVQPISGVLQQNPNNPLLASSSWDGTIKLYDILNERLTLTGHTGPVRAIVLAADQSFLASAGNDGTIRIWRAHKGIIPAKAETTP